jgi:AcrR family transcriptional regulator
MSSGSEAKTAKAPRQSRGRKRVAALLDAGAQVFAEQGYDAATMTEVAQRAGASIGSLYQFFPTKEHLAAALHARQLDVLADLLDALIEDSRGAPLDQVVDRLFARLVDFLEANPALPALAERRSLDPAVKKRARARLRGRIESLLAVVKPPLPAARRAPLAALILYLIRIAAMLKADDDRSIRAPALGELQAMLCSHLSGAGGGKAS